MAANINSRGGRSLDLFLGTRPVEDDVSYNIHPAPRERESIGQRGQSSHVPAIRPAGPPNTFTQCQRVPQQVRGGDPFSTNQTSSSRVTASTQRDHSDHYHCRGTASTPKAHLGPPTTETTRTTETTASTHRGSHRYHHYHDDGRTLGATVAGGWSPYSLQAHFQEETWNDAHIAPPSPLSEIPHGSTSAWCTSCWCERRIRTPLTSSTSRPLVKMDLNSTLSTSYGMMGGTSRVPHHGYNGANHGEWLHTSREERNDARLSMRTSASTPWPDARSRNAEGRWSSGSRGAGERVEAAGSSEISGAEHSRTTTGDEIPDTEMPAGCFAPGDKVELHSFETAFWLEGVKATVKNVFTEKRAGVRRKRIRVKITYDDPPANDWAHPLTVPHDNLRPVGTEAQSV